MPGYSDFVSIAEIMVGGYYCTPSTDCGPYIQQIINDGNGVYIPAAYPTSTVISGGAPTYGAGAACWTLSSVVDFTTAPTDSSGARHVRIQGAGLGFSVLQVPSVQAGFSFDGTQSSKFPQTSQIALSLQLSDFGILGYPSNPYAAIYIVGPSSATIAGPVTFENFEVDYYLYGIILERTKNIFFSNIQGEENVNGIYLLDCGDVDGVNLRMQNGAANSGSYGFGYLVAASGSAAAGVAEGARFANISSNVMNGLFSSGGYNFLHCTNPSFSSCPSNPCIYISDLHFSSFTGGESLIGSSSTANDAVNADSDCEDVRFIAHHAGGKFNGFNAAGSNLIIGHCSAAFNSNADFIISSDYGVISDNSAYSTGATYPGIREVGGGNNLFIGNRTPTGSGVASFQPGSSTTSFNLP